MISYLFRDVLGFGRKKPRQELNQKGRFLQVLSHNVGQDLPDYDTLSKMIFDTNADITLLQEITRDFVGRYWDSRLSKFYPYRVCGPLLQEKGIASGILSHFPIVEVSNFKLTDNALVFQQRAIVDIQGKIVTVYNIHLTFPWIDIKRDPIFALVPFPSYNYRIRSEEIRNLISMVQKESNPVLLGGDFNMSDRSEDYKKLIQNLVDVYSVSGTGFGFSWPANRTPSLYIPIATPFVRIDYVFHTHTFRSSSAKLLKKTGSDHRPLLVEIALDL